jgi:hypothetical protein
MFGDPLYKDTPKSLALYSNEVFVISDSYSGKAASTQAGTESDIMLTRYSTDGEFMF